MATGAPCLDAASLKSGTCVTSGSASTCVVPATQPPPFVNEARFGQLGPGMAGSPAVLSAQQQEDWLSTAFLLDLCSEFAYLGNDNLVKNSNLWKYVLEPWGVRDVWMIEGEVDTQAAVFKTGAHSGAADFLSLPLN